MIKIKIPILTLLSMEALFLFVTAPTKAQILRVPGDSNCIFRYKNGTTDVVPAGTCILYNRDNGVRNYIDAPPPGTYSFLKRVGRCCPSN